MSEKLKILKNYDVVIIGGGVSGVCAAISAARHGAKTALVQNRPVLGGNASSEIRMHICGASSHGSRFEAGETGIVEELLLENRRRNPTNSFSIFDTVLWEKVNFQDGLDLYLNTHMTDVVIEGEVIKIVIAEQITTEKIFEFEGNIFVDATGDGTLASLAGAEFMTGREGKAVFGEKFAPDMSDHYTMGNTLLFKAVDAGYPVPFIRPSWANTYSEEDLAYRNHSEMTSGYWWIELGGGKLNVIGDGEEIRDDLLKALYGVWDHIKNSGCHNAENLVLEWVGFLPGKRDSRRIIGDYVLKEQDLLEGRIFDDAVAYGGWPMDMHVVEGLNTRLEPTQFIHIDEFYTIPYRCLYSKDIKNLMIGGRAISTSHMAFGSTRVMGTCAVVGQAVGTGAAKAVEKGIMPSDVLKYIKELQQILIKDDCFIPGYASEDEKDIAKTAKVSCSSSIEGCGCENVINGYDRRTKEHSNCWVSKEICSEGEWISLDFKEKIKPGEVCIKFDSNLSKEVMISLSKEALSKQIPGIPPELVKDYGIEFYIDGRLVYKEDVRDNYLRFMTHIIKEKIECDSIKVNVVATNGDKHGRIFEIRVY